MKKIVIISSSPRKHSNSESLALAFATWLVASRFFVRVCKTEILSEYGSALLHILLTVFCDS